MPDNASNTHKNAGQLFHLVQQQKSALWVQLEYRNINIKTNVTLLYSLSCVGVDLKMPILLSPPFTDVSLLRNSMPACLYKEVSVYTSIMFRSCYKWISTGKISNLDGHQTPKSEMFTGPGPQNNFFGDFHTFRLYKSLDAFGCSLFVRQQLPGSFSNSFIFTFCFIEGRTLFFLK